MNEVHQEVERKHPLYVAVLDNGVTLLIFDGYAEGSDGKIYKCVDEEYEEDEWRIIGWRCVE